MNIRFYNAKILVLAENHKFQITEGELWVKGKEICYIGDGKTGVDADCTLDYNEAWKLLVSVRLAAQCTDARVNIVVEKLYEKYPDVDALAKAEPLLSHYRA